MDKRIERVESLKFSGYRIRLNTLRPCLDRTQGIVDYKAPENRKELQKFLGTINYDRLFIKDLSGQLKPLYKLLSKDVRIRWSDEEDRPFKIIKAKWGDDLSLFVPDMNKNFTLETDRQDNGLCVCLRQESMPVAYLSRGLNAAERNYGITEKEALATLWVMEKLQCCLLGRRFKLITDQKRLHTSKVRTNLDLPSYGVGFIGSKDSILISNTGKKRR
jgi:hypothetical protein